MNGNKNGKQVKFSDQDWKVKKQKQIQNARQGKKSNPLERTAQEIQKSLPPGSTTGPITVENSFTKAFPYLATGNSSFGALLDTIVADCMRIRDDSIIVPPARLKMYCYWAVATRIKECGRLDGTYGSLMPSMPKQAIIPRALFCFLKYLGKLDWNGVKFMPILSLPTEPAGNSGCLGGSFTGISYSLVHPCGVQVYDATRMEWYASNVDASSFALGTIISNFDPFSEYVESIGVGISYGDLSPYAPDASFYSYISNTQNKQVYNTLPDFNAVVGYICATLLPTAGFYPLYRKAVPDTSSDNTTFFDQLFMSFVFITNRMDGVSIKKRNAWNYFGQKLDDPLVIWRHWDSNQWNNLVNAQLLEYSHLGVTDEEAFILNLLWRGAYTRRLFEFASLESGASYSSIIPGPVYRTIKMPIVLAHVLDSLGPVAKDGILYAPTWDGSVAVSRYSDPSTWWPRCFYGQYVNSSTTVGAMDDYSQCGIKFLGGLTIVFPPVTIDATWIAGANTGTMVYPKNLIPHFLERYNAAGDRMALNSFVTRDHKVIGGWNVLVEADVRQMDSSNFGKMILSAKQEISTVVLIRSIRSYFPIGSKDLFMSTLMCRAMSATTFPHVMACPYVYNSGTNGYDYENWVRLKELIKDTTRQGTDFTTTFGQARLRQRTIMAEVGTAKITLAEPQWWESVINKQMIAMSSQMMGFIGLNTLNIGWNLARSAYANRGLQNPDVQRSPIVEALGQSAVATAIGVGSHLYDAYGRAIQGMHGTPNGVVIEEL